MPLPPSTTTFIAPSRFDGSITSSRGLVESRPVDVDLLDTSRGCGAGSSVQRIARGPASRISPNAAVAASARDRAPGLDELRARCRPSGCGRRLHISPPVEVGAKPTSPVEHLRPEPVPASITGWRPSPDHAVAGSAPQGSGGPRSGRMSAAQAEAASPMAPLPARSPMTRGECAARCARAGCRPLICSPLEPANVRRP